MQVYKGFNNNKMSIEEAILKYRYSHEDRFAAKAMYFIRPKGSGPVSVNGVFKGLSGGSGIFSLTSRSSSKTLL